MGARRKTTAELEKANGSISVQRRIAEELHFFAKEMA